MDDQISNRIDDLAPTSFRARLDRDDPIAVLDVREDHERAYAAIAVPPGVIDLHVPLNRVNERFGEIAEAARGRPLVIYCHHGQRSMVAAALLARRGLTDVHNLDGGIDAWSRRVDPAVRRY